MMDKIDTRHNLREHEHFYSNYIEKLCFIIFYNETHIK
jgi:hypothetical protein